MAARDSERDAWAWGIEDTINMTEFMNGTRLEVLVGTNRIMLE